MERERAEEKGRGAETRRDTGEKGLRGFWLLAPVGGKMKLTRRFHTPVLKGSQALEPGAGTPGLHGL